MHRTDRTTFDPLSDPLYEDALTWLYAQRRDAERDPRRMARLIDALGIGFPANTVHVVGTNGKGSVTAMLAAGLGVRGAPAGRFTSPHVEDFRERITVGDAPISRAEVTAFVDRIRHAEATPRPAFFEVAYAMALDHFARHGVGWAAIEAGVGARNDATAVLANVRLVVVTNVSRDHAATLGPSVAAIADEKAAAVRPGVPLVTGATGVARAILAKRASERGSPLFAEPPRNPLFEPPDPRHEPVAGGAPRSAGRGTEAAGPGPSACPPGLFPDVARRANERIATAGLRVLGAPDARVAAALRAPGLPGRFERFARNGRCVIVDGAHNPGAAALLARALPLPYALVFGALPRKDARGTFHALARRAAAVVLTEAEAGGGRPHVPAGPPFVPDPLEAVDAAMAATPDGVPVLVAGSLYLAGRVRARLADGETAASELYSAR